MDANQQVPKRSLAAKLFRFLLWTGLAIVLLVLVRGYFAFRDRIPGYSMSLVLDGRQSVEQPRPFRAGFARIKITPDLADPKRPVWLAGFSQNRAATGVHDDLWAIACVLDDGYTRVGIVGLDAIGFFLDEVVKVRRRLDPELKISYAVVCSTHNHSTPDLMGLWGPNYLRSGVDPAYREQVVTACVDALAAAVTNLQPVKVAFHEIPTNPENLVSDTRKPTVYDSDIRVMHFRKTGTDETLGTLVGWGNHPETVWSRNTEITSDFCGYLRDALEQGVSVGVRKVAEGVGGIHLYVNGAVGGLMSTTPSTKVQNPYTSDVFEQPSHDKARAVGYQVASRILSRLAETNTTYSGHAPLSVRAKSVDVRLDNKGYLLAGFLGLIERGYVKWRTLRSEVALVGLGDASIACVPGEIYPEIVNGGIEKAPGGDFNVDPVEVPPLRELMPGKIKFVFGLANDEIGYLIPKSQWDHAAPFLYNAERAPYGEINSVGSDAAGTVHAALKELCDAARQ